MTTIRWGDFELSQLMLGTAQFGLPYGVANTLGQPEFGEVCAILEAARAGGVNCLDTAPMYGQSEEVLGRALQATGLRDEMIVVSKCLRVAPEGASLREIEALVESEVRASLRRLQLETLPLCLIHVEENFRFVEALLPLREKGLIGHIGCSCTSPRGAQTIIASGACNAIQIPTSVLDRRFSDPQNGEYSVFEQAQIHNVAVFVRSAYLQGLILMAPQNVPDDLQAALPALKILREVAQESKIGIEELALRYVLGLGGLSSVVVGVESLKQMTHDLEILARGGLEKALMKRLQDLHFGLPDLIFEPWRWQKRMPDATTASKQTGQREA